ncbi:hypothetical protein KA082_01025 [Candidatus Woesebacteria bacterium]|nr:hypothetical protein [Candidatus Woesebacteria bacterium]
MQIRKLLVTHHSPDLDAIGAVWMLIRFDAQHYATARFAFVNPGESLSIPEIERTGVEPHEVTHVDTGMGEFDHHQTDRGQAYLSATKLTYEHVVSLHPELAEDAALHELSDFITEIDHFREIYWPDADNIRYSFMLHELIRGSEFGHTQDDEAQLRFGLQCLDYAYSGLIQQVSAQKEIETIGNPFEVSFGPCLALETSNDDTIKLGQKKGYMLVVKKDPKLGNIRIKVRPDAPVTLEKLRDAIEKVDPIGTWYYHPSGKMLINGSQKHRNQTASPLSLAQVTKLIESTYGEA